MRNLWFLTELDVQLLLKTQIQNSIKTTTVLFQRYKILFGFVYVRCRPKSNSFRNNYFNWYITFGV
jgi:hypothetical protein